MEPFSLLLVGAVVVLMMMFIKLSNDHRDLQDDLDSTQHLTEMLWLAVEAHLNGEHVQLDHIDLTPDGTPIRKDPQE